MPTGVAESEQNAAWACRVCDGSNTARRRTRNRSAELTALPDQTWGVVGLYDSLTTSTPAEVMAIEQIGNTIYVGGQFLEVVRKRSEPHHDQRSSPRSTPQRATGSTGGDPTSTAPSSLSRLRPTAPASTSAASSRT